MTLRILLALLVVAYGVLHFLGSGVLGERMDAGTPVEGSNPS